MARKRYFDIDLCTYSILQESIVTDLLRRIYKNSVRHSSVSIVYCRPAMVGTGEKVSKLKAPKARKRYFKFGYCKYSKCFL